MAQKCDPSGLGVGTVYARGQLHQEMEFGEELARRDWLIRRKRTTGPDHEFGRASFVKRLRGISSRNRVTDGVPRGGRWERHPVR